MQHQQKLSHPGAETTTTTTTTTTTGSAATGGSPCGELNDGNNNDDNNSNNNNIRATSNQKSLSFFRRIMGQRKSDYRADGPDGGGSAASVRGRGGFRGGNAPPAPAPAPPSSLSRSSRDGGGGGGNAAAGAPTPATRLPRPRRGRGCGGFSASFWSSCGRCFRPPTNKRTAARNNSTIMTAGQRRRFLRRAVLQTRPYRFLVLFFSFVLLFGGQIRFLVIPPAGDVACDVVFLLAFVFFVSDIILRVCAEPGYFVLTCCGWTGNPGGREFSRSVTSLRNSGGGRNGGGGGGGGAAYSEHPNVSSSGRCFCCRFEIGSFLFWCDVASTLTLIYSVSFISKRQFDVARVKIDLDMYGVPLGKGFEAVNTATPVEADTNLFVTIAKTARVARFIRSSTAVKISKKVNWYWFLNPLDARWWLTLFCRLRGGAAARGGTAGGGSSRHLIGGGGGGGGGSESHGEDTTAAATADLIKKSWRGVGLGALATVKAQQKAREAQEKKDAGLLKLPVRMMRRVGILRSSDEEWRRQLAATKIQRAWRAVLVQRHFSDDDGYQSSQDMYHDVAWKGGRSSMTQFSTKSGGLVGGGGGGGGGDATALSRRSRYAGSAAAGGGGAGGGGGGGRSSKRRHESQVGSAMRELTGQRVATGIILSLVLIVLFTYTEKEVTRPTTMIVLHSQTRVPQHANRSLFAARSSSVPDLYSYQFPTGETLEFQTMTGEDPAQWRDRDKLRIEVVGHLGNTTVGWFAYREERRLESVVLLLSTVFILLVWFLGVTAFAGPVMILVVIPIERMVRLLGMLMLDPLGYQGTSRYKRFVTEEDQITKNTKWTKEVLKGMETSFLMSTILRIGSLMKVGFGSAGVEIIRNNLEKGHSKNMLILSSQGSTVFCIFLFSDIRQFTDATECLQEEVFVFTNKVAAVVHSICHSYGGSANKNIGDAFLLSWRLEERTSGGRGGFSGSRGGSEPFTAKNNQADKALLSVVKICMALHHDDYYVETLGDSARDALLAKLSKRKGPVVQMGFGLHAGKAVQGAIGSQRKIDATYVSEAVERSEFLESSTKKYGVKMLMSDSFHRLLQPSNRRRCRKVDQILLKNEEDDEDDDYDYLSGDVMELFTFDMDIDALWKKPLKRGLSDPALESDAESGIESIPTAVAVGVGGGKPSIRDVMRKSGRKGLRRSVMTKSDLSSEEMSDAGGGGGGGGGDQAGGGGGVGADGEADPQGGRPQLVLPTGPALYYADVWVSEDMRKIRELYSDGLFFQKFNSGLQSFYAKDWEHARQCFVTILERFEDGPSRYFLTQIEKNNGRPPRDFLAYGRG